MKKIIVLFVFYFTYLALYADEGMWLPFLLEKYTIEQLQKKGFRLTSEDIYSINKACLKDAVVGLTRGGFHHFCSGGLISSKGLMLTNHHCGIGYVQSFSTLQNDYLTNGYWALRTEDELPCSGLSVAFLVRMEDVTNAVMQGITAELSMADINQIIKNNISRIESEAVKNTHYQANVKPVFEGNQYILSVYEIFNDVRLVGVPPQSIGKFGGDTDNWMWPRHTGDFCMFRIYADSSNKPAQYSLNNVPYKPKKSFTISLNGVNENDFTMVLGYPGTTNEYLPSAAVRMIQYFENPYRIMLRQARLEIMSEEMRQNDLVRIQYTSKHAGLANGWKKWIGESNGLKRLNAIDIKQQTEKQFEKWANTNPERIKKYGMVVAAFDSVYNKLIPVNKSSVLIFEGIYGIEIIRLAANFIQLQNADLSKIDLVKKNLLQNAINFYKNYHLPTDRKIAEALMNIYLKQADPSGVPPFITEQLKKFRNNTTAYSDYLFSHSCFTDSAKLIQFIREYNPRSSKKLLKDPVFRLAFETDNFYHNNLEPLLSELNNRLDFLQQLYLQGLMEMDAEKNFYPDANSTFRVAYGSVKPYYPKDAVRYEYFTTLKGIIEKDDPAIPDYVVDDKLKNLYNQRNFMPYFQGNNIPVAFIATNHTTGGNSGSPVVDAYGQLIGINFDRVWEGTMSDIIYDAEMCRNITLDIRYILFIIDKYAGARVLIDEMNIVYN